MPLDLKAEGERAIYRLIHEKQDVKILDTGLDDLSIEPRSHIHSRHPTKAKQFKWTKQSPTGKALELFSDGSKIQNKVGSAFIALHNNEPLFKAAKRLSDHATVFQAESRALKDAAFWAGQFRAMDIHFYTDSMSVLQCLNKTGVIPVHIEALKEILSTLGDLNKVTLHWIRGHQGTAGNEYADRLAKDATNFPTIDYPTPLSEEAAKQKIQTILLDYWQDRWDTADTGRYTHAIFPQVKLKRLKSDFYILQGLTNHGRFPYYFTRFSSNSSRCQALFDDLPLHQRPASKTLLILRTRHGPPQDLHRLLRPKRSSRNHQVRQRTEGYDN
ncbi:uncharacterized protein LOC118189734 [Stegodyphus dumicola]|uniref:uncharacterized protein LOC118189734 n=1 Tax=Stegodyphus dumicola TaxID=202533 RepID=UPI0015AF6ECB|nr:uncharacterized protein LOC118189734 [Stegodyphus dumicola]